jgi:hypothetical protein
MVHARLDVPEVMTSVGNRTKEKSCVLAIYRVWRFGSYGMLKTEVVTS